MERHKTFILGIQDSKCPQCCDVEIHLKHFKDYLDASKFYKGKPIKLARLDISTDRQVVNALNLHVPFVPALFVYKNKEFQQAPDIQSRNLQSLVAFTNRVLHPFVVLQSADDVDRFLAYYRLYPEDNPFMFHSGMRKIENKPTHAPQMKTDMELSPGFYRSAETKTRVIAFFESTEDFAEEYKEFKRAAQRLAVRQDLRVGLVKDPKLVKQLHNTHKNVWFGPFERNAIILKRYSGQIEKLDLLTEKHNIYAWVQRKTLNPIEQYSKDKQRIMDALAMPILGAFVDTRKNAPTELVSKNLVQDLKQLSLYIQNSFIVTYFTNREHDTIREKFGIKHRQVPALGIHYYDSIKGSAVFPYQDFSLSRIKYWMNEIATGRKFPDANPKQDEFRNFKVLVRDARSLMTQSFQDVAVHQSEYDVLLLTYNSRSYDEHSYQFLGLEFKEMIDWLHSKKVSTLMAATIDMASNTWPQAFKEQYKRKTLVDRGLGLYFLNVRDKQMREIKVKNKKVHEIKVNWEFYVQFQDIRSICAKAAGVSHAELQKALRNKESDL